MSTQFAQTAGAEEQRCLCNRSVVLLEKKISVIFVLLTYNSSNASYRSTFPQP